MGKRTEGRKKHKLREREKKKRGGRIKERDRRLKKKSVREG